MPGRSIPLDTAVSLTRAWERVMLVTPTAPHVLDDLRLQDINVLV